MNLNIASKNQIKIDALKAVVAEYIFFSGAKVIPIDVSSGVDKQPKSLQEIIKGARNRAKKSFNDCDYSFGIESGLMDVPHTKTGKMDVCACVIYDGENYHSGLSCAFEYPVIVTEMIIDEGLDSEEAYYKSGLTNERKIGSHEGIIGLLTKGRMDRKEYTKQAIMTALIHLDNLELY